MRRRLGSIALACLASFLVSAGCARKPAPVFHPPKPEPAQHLLSEARDKVANGQYTEGRKLYIRILEEYPESAEAFQARWGMAWIRIDPKSPLRDYTAARINFDRLAADYGSQGGDWLAWVEAWRAVLDRLDAAESEGIALKTKKQALEDDLVDLEGDFDRLRELEMDLELKP
jgi:hypothetical protein